jgi:hypothetical protein
MFRWGFHNSSTCSHASEAENRTRNCSKCKMWALINILRSASHSVGQPVIKSYLLTKKPTSTKPHLSTDLESKVWGNWMFSTVVNFVSHCDFTGLAAARIDVLAFNWQIIPALAIDNVCCSCKYALFNPMLHRIALNYVLMFCCHPTNYFCPGMFKCKNWKNGRYGIFCFLYKK